MKENDIKRLDAISSALYHLLNGQIPDLLVHSDQHDEINQVGGFVNRLISEQKVLLEDSLKLSKGELYSKISSPLPVANGLKNIQAALRHLTWQTKQIAHGDFGQRTDYLGEFSESFNWMVTQLGLNQSALMAEIDERIKVEEKLRIANINMEKLVQERTGELREANVSLQNEIKEGKLAQKALLASEAKYRRLSENSPAVVYQFRMSSDGRFSFPFINDTVDSISGFSIIEALILTLFRVYWIIFFSVLTKELTNTNESGARVKYLVSGKFLLIISAFIFVSTLDKFFIIKETVIVSPEKTYSGVSIILVTISYLGLTKTGILSVPILIFSDFSYASTTIL